AEAPMDNDNNLLLGVLALQAGLIEADQFVEGCKLWSERRPVPLADVLVESGWLKPAARAQLEELIGGQDNHNAPTKAFVRARADTDRPHAFETSPGTAPTTRMPQRYDLKSVHAIGGMGQVWLARDTMLNRDVALKELRPELADDAAYKSRFLREAHITGQLEHPGIVPVYEVSHHPITHPTFYT